MPSKICERCVSLYADLKSTTCPQCFAKLTTVDDETWARLDALRNEGQQSDEFKSAKTADDERFREQSFGACLSVLLIGMGTVVASIVLLFVASHRHHARVVPPADVLPLATSTVRLPDANLPERNAKPDQIVPTHIGVFHRTLINTEVDLPGTMIPIVRAEYENNVKQTLMVWVVATSSAQDQLTIFNQAAQMAAALSANGKPEAEFDTRYWRYAVIGQSGDKVSGVVGSFRKALDETMRSRPKTQGN